jgi:hypothetical protein
MTIRVLIYPRISTTKQTQGESVEDQIKACTQLAKKEGYSTNEIKIYRETGSGRNEHRPVFEKMIDYARETSKIERIYIWDIDRLTRAGAGHYLRITKELDKIGVELVDVAGVIQRKRNSLEGTGGAFGKDFEYDWSNASPSEGAEIQKAHEAENEARKILLRTIKPQIGNIQKGYEARGANYGFRNSKIRIEETGKKKTIREIVPTEAQFLREMYELTVRAVDPLKICERLNRKGFKTRERNKWNKEHIRIIGKTGGNKLTPRRMWELIESVSYAGFKCEKWTWGHLVKAQHAHIVPLDLWNKANQQKYKIIKSSTSPSGWQLLNVKKGKKRLYMKENPEYRFKKLIRCSECQKPLKGSASKGKSGKRFPAYHCSRGHKRVSMGGKELESLLKKRLSGMIFAPPFANLLELGIKELWLMQLRTLNQELINSGEQINELREKAKTISNKIDLLSNPDLIKQKELDYEDIVNEIKTLEGERNKKEYTEKDVIKIMKYVRHFVEHLDELVLGADDQALLQGFWELIFEETPTLEAIKSGTLKISPVIQLKETFEKNENALVAPRGIEPLLQE